ncbi:MAG: ATP-binding protein [Syntrophobacteraceae bacterium]
MNILEKIRKTVHAGDEGKTLKLVQNALGKGYGAFGIMENGLVKGLEDCGVDYQEQRMWLPELMLATEAVKKAAAILIPKMDAGRMGQSLGKVVLATVQGDIHDVGIELVSIMLESAGFSVRFLGGNVPIPDLIAAVKEEEADLLGLSTLLSSGMYVMPDVLKILKAEGLRDSLKVIIGGAVIRQEFCDEIGADGYAPDAVSAIHLAKEKCRELEQKLKNLVIRVDSKGKITFLNEFAENLFGYKKEEVLGKCIAGTLFPIGDSSREYPEAMRDNLLTALKQDPVMETEGMCRSGERVWVAWRNKLILDQNRNVAGVQFVGNDVTERKRSEERLRFDEARFESLLELTQMTDASQERISQFVLEHAVSLTKSKAGFVALLSEDEILQGVHSWFKNGGGESTFADSIVQLPVEVRDLLVEAIRLKKSVVVNDFSADDSGETGSPKDHLSLSRFMVLPACDKDRIVTVAMVANKDEAYSFSDMRQVTLLIDYMRKLIQRKRAEEAVRRSEFQLRQTNLLLQKVVDGISDSLIMLGNDMSIRLLNKAAKDYYGVTESNDIFGRPCHEALRGRVSHCSDCGYCPSIGEGKFAIFERKGLFDPRQIEQVVVYPVPGDSGKSDCFIMRISDVTHRKIMERQLIQNEKLASLGLLVSGIAHEINNPNNFISFNLPILRDYIGALLPIVDEQASQKPDFKLFRMQYARFRQDILKLLDNMEHGSKRIKAIVGDLKKFVTRRENLEVSLTDIKDVIDKVLPMCQEEIGEKVRHFEIDIPGDLPAINSDAGALQQVILNLLINAAQACDKKSSRVRVSARMEDAAEPRLIIEVSDNGCGMDEQTRDKIFDPFFTTKPPSSGIGLGLYLCYNLVRSLGGKIEVDSEVGQGSSFRVILADMARCGD